MSVMKRLYDSSAPRSLRDAASARAVAVEEERRVVMKDATEAWLERRAIQSVSRQEDAEFQSRIEKEARSVRPVSTGLCCRIELGRTVAIERRQIAEVRAGRISRPLGQLRADVGPPEPPAVPTGWYECGDGFYRVGAGPYPEYRPPGLKWRTYWTIPKPDDVPWEDEDDPPSSSSPKLLDDETAARVDEYRSELLAKDRRLREPTGLRDPSGRFDQLMLKF